MNPLKHFLGTLLSTTKTSSSMNKTSIYDIKINALNGQTLDLSKFKGKYMLFVNVASKCGFTPQYKDLQELSETFKDTLTIIGVPCNQFGSQEPGSTEEIANFCAMNYGVTFPITEKLDVKGSQQHELYQWLTQEQYNGIKSSTVKWNFQKYIVDPNGNFLDYYFSMTSPLSSKITKYLK